MPNTNGNSRNSCNNQPLRDFIQKGLVAVGGVDTTERVKNVFIAMAFKFPKQPVPARFLYKAALGGRLPVVSARNNEEVNLMKKVIRNIRSNNWMHNGHPVIYCGGRGDLSGYRLCVDADDHIVEVMRPCLRKVDRQMQNIQSVVAGINPDDVNGEEALELLDRGRVVSEQLLLPEGEMDDLMKDARQKRTYRLLKKGA